jgi:uncharacterized SAM-binding protein YcdF (DUF218 family)
MRRSRHRVVGVVVGVFAAAVLAADVVLAVFTWQVLRPSEESLQPADAIVVLSGEDRRLSLGLELADQGLAPVLVVSFGTLWEEVSGRCGDVEPFEVSCPEPDEDSTRGEARMIARLIDEHGWRSVIVVTGDYHVARARQLVGRCVSGPVDVRWALVDWENVPPWVMRGELAKRVHASVVQRGC